MVKVVGVAEIVKSGTVSVMVAGCVTVVPLTVAVPVTVTVYA
jgi:hypothetical protein